MTLDYLIIGAGPAGLQLAALLEREGRDYLVLEAGPEPGTFFTRYPAAPATDLDQQGLDRFRRSGVQSALRLELAAHRRPGAAVRATSADATSRTRTTWCATSPTFAAAGCGSGTTPGSPGSPATATCSPSRPTATRLTARRVVVATGVSQLYVPPIDGVELAERYDTVSVDPEDFTNQRVLIIGKGNSAFETADALVETAAVIHVAGPHSIRLAWQTHYVGHLRAVNNNFLDTYQLKSQNAVLDGTVERIARRDDGGYRIDFRYARTSEVDPATRLRPGHPLHRLPVRRLASSTRRPGPGWSSTTASPSRPPRTSR